jgi:hypothetical protein
MDKVSPTGSPVYLKAARQVGVAFYFSDGFIHCFDYSCHWASIQTQIKQKTTCKKGGSIFCKKEFSHH